MLVFETLLFAVLPYVCVMTAVLVGIYRYFGDRFSYSSFSSQFLENRMLFWGSIPWHYGILAVLSAHLFVLLFPGVWATFIASPVSLYTLEVLGLSLGLSALAGLSVLIARRLQNARIMAVTSTMDWVMLAGLFIQVLLGCWIALSFRWGSGWSLYTIVPWLVSLVKLSPDISYITPLPGMIQGHILGGFFLIALLPFTRLVHLFTFPLNYLWRPLVRVVWNRRSSSQIIQKRLIK